MCNSLRQRDGIRDGEDLNSLQISFAQDVQECTVHNLHGSPLVTKIEVTCLLYHRSHHLLRTFATGERCCTTRTATAITGHCVWRTRAEIDLVVLKRHAVRARLARAFRELQRARQFWENQFLSSRMKMANMRGDKHHKWYIEIQINPRCESLNFSIIFLERHGLSRANVHEKITAWAEFRVSRQTWPRRNILCDKKITRIQEYTYIFTYLAMNNSRSDCTCNAPRRRAEEQHDASGKCRDFGSSPDNCSPHSDGRAIDGSERDHGYCYAMAIAFSTLIPRRGGQATLPCTYRARWPLGKKNNRWGIRGRLECCSAARHSAFVKCRIQIREFAKYQNGRAGWPITTRSARLSVQLHFALSARKRRRSYECGRCSEIIKRSFF